MQVQYALTTIHNKQRTNVIITALKPSLPVFLCGDDTGIQIAQCRVYSEPSLTAIGGFARHLDQAEQTV